VLFSPGNYGLIEPSMKKEIIAIIGFAHAIV